jgi:hypothetical protein
LKDKSLAMWDSSKKKQMATQEQPPKPQYCKPAQTLLARAEKNSRAMLIGMPKKAARDFTPQNARSCAVAKKMPSSGLVARGMSHPRTSQAHPITFMCGR